MSELKARTREIQELGSVSAILAWDQETMMPENASHVRAAQMGCMARLVHARLTDPALEAALKKGAREIRSLRRASKVDLAIIRETERVVRRARRIKPEINEELARLSVIAHREWIEARRRSDFRLIRKRLERIVTLKRLVADAIGYDAHPYDALLDGYEPGMTAARLDVIFGELASGARSLLSLIRVRQTGVSSRRVAAIRRGLSTSHSPETQNSLRAFCLEILSAMGFEMKRGRLDTAYHPFAVGVHPDDVRVTFRLDRNLLDGIFSTLHEGGHALYEQGLPRRHWGTPVCGAVSLGVHESQSRMWENIVGRSPEFWERWWPRLKKAFPRETKGVTRAEWMAVVNEVKPLFIRVDSDEVTYNLHIILRYELERDLIGGSLKVKDLPEAWNARMLSDLGLSPRNEAEGVLQDVHWYAGIIGYFPTYALGNCYAAQLMSAFLERHPDWPDRLKRGDWSLLGDWSARYVHAAGALYPAEELMRRATGEDISARALLGYLERKFGVSLRKCVLGTTGLS